MTDRGSRGCFPIPPPQAGPRVCLQGQGALSLSALRGWESAVLCASKEEPGLKVLPEIHGGVRYQDQGSLNCMRVSPGGLTLLRVRLSPGRKPCRPPRRGPNDQKPASLQSVSSGAALGVTHSPRPPGSIPGPSARMGGPGFLGLPPHRVGTTTPESQGVRVGVLCFPRVSGTPVFPGLGWNRRNKPCLSRLSVLNKPCN